MKLSKRVIVIISIINMRVVRVTAMATTTAINMPMTTIIMVTDTITTILARAATSMWMRHFCTFLEIC